jgi:hypothetical protein
VLPQRDGEGGVQRVVEEAAGDEGGEVAQDDAEAGSAEGWGGVGRAWIIFLARAGDSLQGDSASVRAGAGAGRMQTGIGGRPEA